MPTVKRLAPLPNSTPLAEPVTVADAVAEWRLPVDLTATDEATKAEIRLIERKLKAARELVENHVGDYYVGGQRLAYTFRLDESYAVPEGATVESVSGFFADLTALESWSWEEYRKGISINRELPLCVAARQTYTVVVALPGSLTPDALVVESILELGGEFYRNRETSASAGTVPRELPVSYRVKLAPLVRKPVLF